MPVILALCRLGEGGVQDHLGWARHKTPSGKREKDRRKERGKNREGNPNKLNHIC